MKHQLLDTNVHVATGGRTFKNDGEALVFIHGSGQSHLTWILQSRYFAYRGYQVLAPDLPGHGLSGGTPLDSIEAMADWVIVWTSTLLALLDIRKAVLSRLMQLLAILTALRGLDSLPALLPSQ